MDFYGGNSSKNLVYRWRTDHLPTTLEKRIYVVTTGAEKKIQKKKVGQVDVALLYSVKVGHCNGWY